MAVITLKIVVSNLTDVMETFNRIKVYRSINGITGTYVEITDPTTRIALVTGQTAYEYTDETGDAYYYYKSSYYHTVSGLESSLSEAQQGERDAALDVITVQELKDHYLFGLDLTDDAGNEYPESLYENFIKSAVSWMEQKLDIPIIPLSIEEEKHDYIREEYTQYMFMKLFHYPIIDVSEVRLVLPTEVEVKNFEREWFRIQKEVGHLQLVPGATSTVTVPLVGISATWYPYLYAARRLIPDAFRVSYTAGFESGTVPDNIKDIIAKKACFGPLNIAGDLLGGAGIASQSLSIDGLSSTFNTTCLHPETEIILGDGSLVPIISLVAFDTPFEVRTLNRNYEATTGMATRAFPTIQATVWEVHLSNGQVLRTSDNHLFQLRESGFWVEASKLLSGSKLMPVEGKRAKVPNVTVRKVIQTNEMIQMYDLEVPGFACFGVDGGVIVHNSSATNAGYGARLLQYKGEIKDDLPALQKYWKGLKITVG